MKQINLIFFSLIILILSGCSDSDGGISGTGAGSNSYQVTGVAQKGPFLIGSRVTVNRLNSSGVATEGALTTETTDSLGNFEFELDRDGAVQIKVNGLHYNELTGDLSDDKLELNAITYLDSSGESKQQTINVNMLTHLTAIRIKTLMAQGLDVKTASLQAENEWLEELEPLASVENIFKFSVLNLYQQDAALQASNNYLLFITSVFYQYAQQYGNSSLVELLNTTASDFGDDGKINQNLNMLNELEICAMKLDAALIQDNLESLSQGVVGEKIPAADISSFLKQLLIASPAEGASVDSETMINVIGIINDPSITYTLFVDGVKTTVLEKNESNFIWQPYFWASDNESKHTLLVEAKSGDNVLLSNLVNVSVNFSLNNVLTLRAPSDQEIILNTIKPLLEWEALAGVTEYEVQVFSEDNNVTPVFSSTTSFTEIKSSELSKGRYSWRIRAANDLKLYGPWSSLNTFVIDGPEPPVNDSMSSNKALLDEKKYEVGLTWGEVEHANNYVVQVATDKTFDHIYDEYTVIEHSINNQMEVGTYYWRVSAIDENGVMGAWSESRILKVGTFTKHFGGTGDDTPSKILASKNGGYIILASTTSLEVSEGVDTQGDDWVIRIDDKGDVLWGYVSHASGGKRFYDIVELSDGSVVMVGADSESKKAVALKLDEAGKKDWEKLYCSSTYCSFNNVVEFNDELYVSSEVITDDIKRIYLHAVSISDGSVSGPIDVATTMLDVLTEYTVALRVTSAGDLLIAGLAGLDVGHGITDEFSYFKLLNTDLCQVGGWNNVGEFSHSNVTDVIELSNGQFAIIGQAFENAGPSISVVNMDGSGYKNYRSDLDEGLSYSRGSISSGENGELFTLVEKEGGVVLLSVDEKLNRDTKIDVLGFGGILTPYGLTRNTDSTFTFLLSHKDENSNNYDIVLTKRKM